jgi:tRNA-dihydrouridine synthase B
MRRHFDLMEETGGEESGCRQFRKIALQYSKRFGPTKEFDKRVVKLRHRAEFKEIITAYRHWRAKLLDPAGPNELWQKKPAVSYSLIRLV